jgi:hypothetical protein
MVWQRLLRIEENGTSLLLRTYAVRALRDQAELRRNCAPMHGAECGSAKELCMNIVIGVSGGIACYKAAEVSTPGEEGHNVDVFMTSNAREFVTPLTFQTLFPEQGVTEMFGRSELDSGTSLCKKGAVFAVVPPPQTWIGKIACGIADEC